MAPRKGKHQHSSSIAASTSEPPNAADDTDAYINALNLTVLNRHDNEVVNVVYRAHYAVVYLFAPESQQWEKSGIEGSIFICQLAPNHESMARYKVICLNRRGLDNFNFELGDDDQIEFTDEFIVFHQDDVHVYGIWIFFEPEPSSTARQPREFTEKLKDALDTVQKARQLSADPTQQNHPADMLPRQENNGAHGQRLSLSQIFGQQNQHANTWNGGNRGPVSVMQTPSYQQGPGPIFPQAPGHVFNVGLPGQTIPVNHFQQIPGLQHASGHPAQYYQQHVQQQHLPQQQHVQQQHVQPPGPPLGSQQQHLLGLFQKVNHDHPPPF